VAKCAPPLRVAVEQRGLWDALVGGQIDVVASDHSPARPEMKNGDFMSAWGGIAGVQSTLAVLLERGWHERQLPLERIAALTATEPARRFRIRRKGSIAPGQDADLTLIDPNATVTLGVDNLQQRHKMSPYLGASFHGSVRRTIRRGETIFMDGRIPSQSCGTLVRPG